MKTFTCKEMGGWCDAKISGATPKEVMDNGWKHMEEVHQEEAAKMKGMPKEEGAKWEAEFMKNWDAKAEDKV